MGPQGGLKEEDMCYLVKSRKSFARAAKDLERAVRRHGFDIVGVHDLGVALRSQGAEFDEECRIFEVCDPAETASMLANDMRLNMVIPSRISVFTDGGNTEIGVLRPTDSIAGLSRAPELQEVAEQVEAKMIEMIDDAR